MIEKTNKNLIPIAIVVAGVLIAGAVVFINQQKTASSEILSAEQAGEKTINFIRENLLAEGTTASLISIVEESGIYKIQLKIEDQEYPSYVTRDGKLLFPDQGINLDEEIPVAEEPVVEAELPEKEYSEEILEILAKCLDEKGAKFYGSPTCPWCTKQKEIFGQAVEYLPYVDCAEKRDECEAANVGGVPDWRFPDGSQQLGMLTIEKLAELSGCELE